MFRQSLTKHLRNFNQSLTKLLLSLPLKKNIQLVYKTVYTVIIRCSFEIVGYSGIRRTPDTARSTNSQFYTKHKPTKKIPPTTTLTTTAKAPPFRYLRCWENGAKGYDDINGTGGRRTGSLLPYTQNHLLERSK
jgi:hypothetical protein